MCRVDADKMARSFAKIVTAMMTKPETRVDQFNIICQQDIDIAPYLALPQPVKSSIQFMILERMLKQPGEPAIDFMGWQSQLSGSSVTCMPLGKNASGHGRKIWKLRGLLFFQIHVGWGHLAGFFDYRGCLCSS